MAAVAHRPVMAPGRAPAQPFSLLSRQAIALPGKTPPRRGVGAIEGLVQLTQANLTVLANRLLGRFLGRLVTAPHGSLHRG